jgi:nucleoside-diphosphate-sugar epimerase
MENKETVLVTGGTGYVGLHVIFQLLGRGYKVRTTLRDINRKSEVLEVLKDAGIALPDNIEFVQADLTKDAHWPEAARNCTYVLHVASPMPAGEPKDENEVIRPAVDGTLRVLKAARDAGVRRVVITSNFGAVGYSHTDPHTAITEEEWTDPNKKGLPAYHKSKVLAERAAWDFIHNEGGDLELTVVNPVFIQGPSLGPDLSGSFHILEMLLSGSMKALPNINFNIVDVRDVADLHIRAMTHPEAGGQRFLAMAGGAISLPQIAKTIKSRMPDVSQKVSTRVLPDWVIRVAALFNRQAKGAAGLLGINRNISTEKSRRVLGWTPRFNNEEAIVASVNSMIKFGKLK